MPIEPLNSFIRIWKEAEALLALFRWFRVLAERKLTEFARNVRLGCWHLSIYSVQSCAVRESPRFCVSVRIF